MSNTIGNNSRPATVVRPTVPAKAPISRPSADSLERTVSAVTKTVSAPINKPKATVTPNASADQLQRQLSQSRPSATLAGPRPSSTWGAAAAIAGSTAVASIGQTKTDPKNNPNDVLRGYAQKAGEDLSDGLTDEVLDKVRDGLVERAENCAGTSGTEDLKKFDRAQLASDLAKATLDTAQAESDLKNATTPEQRAKAMVDLAEAQRDAALAVGEFAENSAERQRLEEACKFLEKGNSIYDHIPNLNELPNVNTPPQERPGQQSPLDTQGGVFTTPIVVTSPGILVTTTPDFELAV